MQAEKIKSFTERIMKNCNRVIVGKDEVIRQIIVCFLAEGHVLLEDVPGTGKTMLLRSFAKSIGGDFRRIQFTPDLLPSDLVGINYYNQKTCEFEFRKGPLFANVILADEINRATPRTQSALLESMEEKQISVDGDTYSMDRPYIVMATENPIESYGTFPLPDAQVDRFFMKLSMGYMKREEEISIMRRKPSASLVEELNAVVSKEEYEELTAMVSEVTISDAVANYIMDIVEYTRNDKSISVGVSPRGTLALFKAAQITAAMEGRDYVIPEDVQKEAVAILAHRISAGVGSRMDCEKYIERIIEEVQVPIEEV